VVNKWEGTGQVIIAAEYSFNGGKGEIQARWPDMLVEVEGVLAAVDAAEQKTKMSREKTMPGQVLYSPVDLNKAIGNGFMARGWHKQKVSCEYPTSFYRPGYEPKGLRPGAFREMDFVKNLLGIEVQFGKYAFMVYNVCAKMTIFHKLGYIDCGVEIVPVKSFADEMSTGVSYFEQFVWDLEKRGKSDIDIPVLIYGIDH
jgi:hypothetical protein